MSSTPLPGWYPDPSGAPRRRYWDGTQWTGHAPARPTLSRRGLWVVFSAIVSAALFFGACSAMIAHGSRAHTNISKQTGPTVSRGVPVRDGNFEFVVSGVRAPADPRTAPAPRGEWVIVTVAVRNIDNDPQAFIANNQKLIDSAGRIYSADAEAAVAINHAPMVINMNPGLNITVKVPFDVPAGTAPAAIEVHDSVFSSGARVHVN